MAESGVKKLSTVLLDASVDKDPLVQEQIFQALCYLGESEVEETLHACDEYLRKHEKLPYPSRIIILKAMESVVKNNLDDLDKDTAKMVILLASLEMTRSKEVIFDWQQAASSVLVAVGKRFINQVMEEVLTKFQPGVLPHYFIMQTFANLSVSNVFGMVPFLNSILGTMVPMLGMAKQDQMKCGFCYALQHFGESILEYLANLDKAPDPTVRKDTFSCDLFHAYDVLFHFWLPSREAKLRLAVVEALGPMSQLLPCEKLEEQLPRLIPGILALYKKHAEAFYLSKSLGQILEASVDSGSRTLEVQLDALLSALHVQICAPVDSSNPLVVKNHNEVLRCFTVLACSFPDRLLAFLLPKLENNNERIRVGTLLVMRQVINSASTQMEIKKPFILSSMRLPLMDTNNKVKRAVVQVISAMAHHGYLEQPGGTVMLEYIVRQCALAPDPSPKKQSPDTEDLTSDSVRIISINTLYLISTTVDRMNEVLWPFLLEFLTPIQFTNALTPLCKSLVHLAAKRQEEGENAFLLQYDSHVNLPSPFALKTRLLIVSSHPFLGEGRGVASLRLLGALHLNIHPAVGPRWKKTIPALVDFLEENTEDSLSQKEWEERLLMFLRDTLTVVAESTWISQLSLEMCQQLNCYNGSPLEKNFLYKCIGTTLGVCSNKDMVRKQLQELLETARYQEESEREGLACSFGICAVTHLDDTLAKLEDFVKSDVFKKTIGRFTLFKDRNDTEVEKVKSTLILCYGHVAVQAPPELVLSRIEADILRNVFQYFNTKVLGIKVETKDLTLKLCLIRSLCMISQAICNSVQATSFVFTRKAELVAQMVEFIKAEPLDSLRTPIRKRAMITCSYLVPLEPPLGEPERTELIQACLHSVLVLPAPAGLVEDSGQELLYFDTVSALKDLLTSLIVRDMTPHGLQDMFKHLGPWVKSVKEHERERAVGVSACLLRYFLERLHVRSMVPFHNLGVLLGLVAPRCSDSLATIRQPAVDCVYSLLCIQLSYEGFAQDHRDNLVETLLPLKDGLVNPDYSVLFRTCFSIATVIGKRLPPDQLVSLLFVMFEALGDVDKNCSRAATVMINCLLKERGSGLLEKVPEMVGLVHSKLQEVSEEHVQKAAQQTVYILASQHKAAVVGSLLASALPFDRHVCAMWRALALEPSLTSQILELLLEKMNKDVPFKENKPSLLSSSYDRIATVLPLAATCALYEIMSAPESGAAVLGLYPELFVTLLLRVSCTVGVQLPRGLQSREKKSSHCSPGPRTLDPCSGAVETLQAMLLRGGGEEVVKAVGLAGGWELMTTLDGHPEGTAQLARAMAKHAGPRLPMVVKTLAPILNSVFEIQRVTATAFFAELLGSNVVNDLPLLEPLLDHMTGRQRDPCACVRRLALRGLANIATSAPDKVRRHGPQLLTSMINGLDDKDDPHNAVALEAVAGLSLLLAHVEEQDARSLLLHMAIRIRPFFDSEEADFRKSSVELFGNLNKFCHGNCEDVFQEQIVSGLVALLLHLQDPKPAVVDACRFALRMCGPNMACQELDATFQMLRPEAHRLHYGEFLNDVCKHLMQSFPDLLSRFVATNLFYFKSCWEAIRAAAAMFVGFLVLHGEREHCWQLDLDHLISALQVLLKDPVPTVRIKAAEALGRLVKFA
ncbi:maestro heat-like repeat-containing protein family member 1 isoform X1 [Tachyglossus aculeatus]|uniref:maestro heat-like repeat-containing protein family member 1 isoform X1 n=1 Tax=Tachyglossus aculeatus TaxID=9261 RepID=UPI0018F6E919|nr:maestro heat-like repeat-containing protein family member 1 isoform X1 [Tachyglossus aculeatus]